jgi:CHAD domain-containing protein
MAYALAPSDPDLSASLRRIVDEELTDALSRYARIEQPEAVHGLRKNLKKTRALLRLVKSGLKDQPTANATLRDVGRALSARRDAQVRLATLLRLFPDPPDLLQPLRRHLETASLAPVANLPPGLGDLIAGVRNRAATWTLHGKDAHILRDGLSRTRRDAQTAMQAARKDPGSEALIHEWRKRAKDVWYQSRLFGPAWPELFKPLISGADRLGELLGDHHDLSVFAAHVGALPETLLSDPARRLLDARIRDTQSGIEAEAFPLGARLLAGDPQEVAALWIDWRRVSRQG